MTSSILPSSRAGGWAAPSSLVITAAKSADTSAATSSTDVVLVISGVSSGAFAGSPGTSPCASDTRGVSSSAASPSALSRPGALCLMSAGPGGMSWSGHEWSPVCCCSSFEDEPPTEDAMTSGASPGLVPEKSSEFAIATCCSSSTSASCLSASGCSDSTSSAGGPSCAASSIPSRSSISSAQGLSSAIPPFGAKPSSSLALSAFGWAVVRSAVVSLLTPAFISAASEGLSDPASASASLAWLAGASEDASDPDSRSCAASPPGAGPSALSLPGRSWLVTLSVLFGPSMGCSVSLGSRSSSPSPCQPGPGPGRSSSASSGSSGSEVCEPAAFSSDTGASAASTWSLSGSVSSRCSSAAGDSSLLRVVSPSVSAT
mmetsp:Transcript_15263/g.48630  ORF Transcript_15263/g.48630 Transcript_15263/m.48630 type:complete len:374 (+) Transcript_15263:2423-3544(+)